MCICIYMYKRIYMYTHTYIYIYVYIYIYTLPSNLSSHLFFTTAFHRATGSFTSSASSQLHISSHLFFYEASLRRCSLGVRVIGFFCCRVRVRVTCWSFEISLLHTSSSHLLFTGRWNSRSIHTFTSALHTSFSHLLFTGRWNSPLRRHRSIHTFTPSLHTSSSHLLFTGRWHSLLRRHRVLARDWRGQRDVRPPLHPFPHGARTLLARQGIATSPLYYYFYCCYYY